MKTVNAPKKSSNYFSHSGSSVKIYSIYGIWFNSYTFISLIVDYNSALSGILFSTSFIKRSI